MRFKLTIVAHPGQDIEDLTVNFTAPNWKAASDWARTFQLQAGVHGEATITYADMTPEEVEAREQRRRQRFEPGYSGW